MVEALTGIYSNNDILLSGSGTTATRGEVGVYVKNELTVNGNLTIESTDLGIVYEYGENYKLTGDGDLTVRMIPPLDRGIGIWCNKNLEMAFIGNLSVHGVSGGDGHGIFVNFHLVITETPKSLDVQAGTNRWAYTFFVGELTNHTNINIIPYTSEPVVWPDFIPPSVTSVTPDGSNVSLNGYFTIDFSETMRINSGAVTLTENSSLPGSTTITLIPDYWNEPYCTKLIVYYSGLKYGTSYTLNISGFEDIAGNPMTVYPGHTFTTVEGMPIVHSGGGGGGGANTVSLPQTNYIVAGDRIHLSIPRSDIQKLSDSGNSLSLQSDTVKIIFRPLALHAILDAAAGLGNSITFTAQPADISTLTEAARLIGSRPAYDFAISCKDTGGTETSVKVNFPPGSATVAMNYIPEAGETAGSLFMIYADESGSVTWLPKSCYSANAVLVDIPHFSVYGVGCYTQIPAFSDTNTHWAKEDIEFVLARGLLTGTQHSLFSPDSAVTRGDLAAALGRLAGVSPENYQTRSFSDVRADAFYAPYIEWAAQNNLINPTDGTLFDPDGPVTREQMAVIISNYAGLTGYTDSAPLNEAPFADSAAISPWAVNQVTAMQKAGILKGKNGNIFEPQVHATRAEISALLHRFVEVTAEPSTAQGWKKNDSGCWLYYRGGKALTGWQNIDHKEYYFASDGTWSPEAEKEAP